MGLSPEDYGCDPLLGRWEEDVLITELLERGGGQHAEDFIEFLILQGYFPDCSKPEGYLISQVGR